MMVTLVKKFKTGMIAFGAMAFMMLAGWQFGVSGTDEVFTDKEVALENAFAGSGSCKVEVLSCRMFKTRQICHINGNGVDCTCGQSTEC
jgi:hypothetical protein